MNQAILTIAVEERDQLRNWLEDQMPAKLRSKLDESDIIQQTFLDLVSYREPIKINEGACSAWLFSVVRHNLLDGMRRFVSQKRAIGREQEYDQASDAQGRGQQNCEAEGLRSEDRQNVLRSVLERLPPDYRAVLKMHFLEGKSYAEVGALVDRSEDAVRMLANRALKAALKILNSDGYTSPSL